MEILIAGVLIIIALVYSNKVNPRMFVKENDIYLKLLKEKDYDFYVSAKYGDKVNADDLFNNRLKTTFIGSIFAILLFIINMSFINFIAMIVLIILVYKMPYITIKSHYKKYMHEIDQMLPYYLKGLEILCQNYTVPVAISKSIEDAPDIFKPGLREMIAKIDAGDSSIQPYMDFAIKYPVRDSMRMMRLLYRLSLGIQENKYKQLLMFSKSVSNLQNKAREVKYKNRLSNMERRTMIMLIVTGGGTMVILLLSTIMLFGI